MEKPKDIFLKSFNEKTFNFPTALVITVHDFRNTKYLASGELNKTLSCYVINQWLQTTY